MHTGVGEDIEARMLEEKHRKRKKFFAILSLLPLISIMSYGVYLFAKTDPSGFMIVGGILLAVLLAGWGFVTLVQ